MECVNCHQDIAEGDAFCRHCGTKVPTPPGPCPSCGRVNEDDARFCVQCGTSLVPAGAPTAAATPGQAPSPAPLAPAETAPAAETAAPTAPAAETAPPAPTPPPAPTAVGATPPTAGAAEAAPPAAPFAAPTAAATPASPAMSPAAAAGARPLTLVGAAAAVVGALLPWLSAPGNSANGFDVPVNFLVDYQTTASHDFSAGLIVVVLGVAAALAVLLPKLAARIPLLAVGVVILVVAAAYLGQLWRLTDYAGVSYSDNLGLGPIVAAVGGALVITRR